MRVIIPSLHLQSSTEMNGAVLLSVTVCSGQSLHLSKLDRVVLYVCWRQSSHLWRLLPSVLENA